MNVEKLKSGTYRAKVYCGRDENKKIIWKSFTAPTRKEVVYLASQFENEHHLNMKDDLNYAITNYLKTNERSLSPTTYRTYVGYQKYHFKRLLETKISDVTIELIQNEIDEEQKIINPRTNKPITTDFIRKCVSFYLMCAHKADRSFRIKIDDLKFKRGKAADIRVPTPSQMDDILKAIEGSNVELPILLACQMSLRTEEIRGLWWTDIEGRYLHIQRAKVLHDVVKETKTGTSERLIPITPDVDRLLKTYHHEDESPFIFNFGKNFIYERFQSLLKQNGLELWTVHSMRHYFASLGLSMNIPEKTLEELGGWSPHSSVMRRIYQTVWMEVKEDAMSKMFGKK